MYRNGNSSSSLGTFLLFHRVWPGAANHQLVCPSHRGWLFGVLCVCCVRLCVVLIKKCDAVVSPPAAPLPLEKNYSCSSEILLEALCVADFDKSIDFSSPPRQCLAWLKLYFIVVSSRFTTCWRYWNSLRNFNLVSARYLNQKDSMEIQRLSKSMWKKNEPYFLHFCLKWSCVWDMVCDEVFDE